MSIIIGFANRTEGAILVDTLCHSLADPGRKFEVAKAFPVAHLGMVYGVRGTASFAAQFLQEIHLRGIDDFDTLADQFLAVVSDAYDVGRGTYEDMGEDGQAQLAMVGWSRARNMPVGIAASSMTRAGGGFEALPFTGGVIAIPNVPPGWDAAGGSKRKKPEELLIALAEKQREIIEEAAGPGNMGGRLIRHGVTRHGVESRVIHTWKADLPVPVSALPYATAKAA